MSDYELVQEYETVKLWRDGGAAKVELTRAQVLNAWNSQLSADLKMALDIVAVDPEVRAVCLTGEGRAFCSGADLTPDPDAPMTPTGRPDLYRSLHEKYHPSIKLVRRMDKPVISAVRGGAVGVGLSLALAADYVVASENAYFLLAFVNIGLVPDGGASAFVANRVGFTRAMEMALLGEKIGAEQAERWGLINRVVPDEGLADAADELVRRFAAGPTRSYAGTKRQLNAWTLRGLDDQLEIEASIQLEMAHTEDFVEGVMAFMQKRHAAFSGR